MRVKFFFYLLFIIYFLFCQNHKRFRSRFRRFLFISVAACSLPRRRRVSSVLSPTQLYVTADIRRDLSDCSPPATGHTCSSSPLS